ncbi:CDP-alcohol phosphatidyltransferase family protein [Amycolatopsis minnesotensis]|uniref:CDP-alcohol phosphatidyltransferase family protein n=1 Tax=Amycolatopsis minnesotensis TaxID=337894 RepID=A0ABN2S484_9PSEU
MSSFPAKGTRFTETLERLPSAQKSAKGAPAYSRFVNRRAGGYLAAAAYHLGRTPNQVSAISAAFTFTGIAVIALAPPVPVTGFAVCLALVAGYAFDAADGQLARLRGGGSLAGEWLDHVIDALKIATLHLSVLVSAYRFSDLPKGFLLVPIGFSVVASVQFFALILNEQLRHRAGAARLPGGKPSPVRSLLVVPTDYGVLCLGFALLGFPAVFEPLYGLLFAANAAFLAAALPKWYRDARGLARQNGPGQEGPA